MTTLASSQQIRSIRHQQRLRETVKCLVIELGYLEKYLPEQSPEAQLRTAAVNIDTAIACLNDYLAR